MPEDIDPATAFAEEYFKGEKVKQSVGLGKA